MRIALIASRTALAIALGATPEWPARAQESEPPEAGQTVDPETGENTIVVFGRRLIGEIEAPQPPLLELGEEDIAAYGVGSIDELLQQLTPQITSARGRGGGGFPVILVNGVRVSSFRELRNYPPEAIQKVEVLPEEVAQQYGFSPDQRVVNFILKDNFQSREIELEYGQPWDGGRSSQEVEATYLRIDGPSRLNLNLGWDNASLLTEEERGIIKSVSPSLPRDPDPARFRSLAADTAGLEASANWSKQLGDPGSSLSLNATFERDDALRLQGLDTVLLTDSTGASVLRSFNAQNPLAVNTRSKNYSASAALNTRAGDWEVTGTLDGNHTDSRTRIGRRVDTGELISNAANGLMALDAALGDFDPGADEALSDTYTFNSLVTARNTAVSLPAGDVSLTLDAGYNWNRIESSDTRNLSIDTQLTRGRINGGINLSVPIAERGGPWGSIGDLSLNLQVGLDYLSDFGTRHDLTTGLTWGITDRLTATVTWIKREEAPSLTQLGAARIATPNVQVFDIARNETVLVTVITGGNFDLPAQSQSDWKLGLIWEVDLFEQANFSLDYIRNRSDDAAVAFPVLTPAIEAAFPGRVTRDPAGRLVQLDERPISFARQDVERLQLGLNLSGQIGSSGQGGRGERRRGGAPGPGGMAGAGSAAPRTEQVAARFDPARFAALRTALCGEGGADIAMRLARGEQVTGNDGEAIAFPPQMLERLRANGEPEPAQVERLRSGICAAQTSEDTALRGPGQGGTEALDRDRFAALRQLLCGENGIEVALRLARGEAVAGPDGEAVTLPPMMAERITQGGEPDPERVEQVRQGLCDAQVPPAGAESSPGGGRGGGGGGRSGGVSLPGFGGGTGGPGRWFLNLQYTLELRNEALVAPGGPLLDLLDGDALSGGGQPRHSANIRAGAFYKGFGSFLTARYTGVSRIAGTGLPGSSELFFDDFATLDWRFFVDLGRQASVVEALPFLDDVRLSFEVENIFDARQRVTDGVGETPLRYQPFLVDPLGRVLEIELRKLF